MSLYSRNCHDSYEGPPPCLTRTTRLIDITRWLSVLGLDKHSQAFIENEIDIEMLVNLSDGDLNPFMISLRGVSIRSICVRRRCYWRPGLELIAPVATPMM